MQGGKKKLTMQISLLEMPTKLLFAALLLAFVGIFMQPNQPEQLPAEILDAPHREWHRNEIGDKISISGLALAFLAFCLKIILVLQHL